MPTKYQSVQVLDMDTLSNLKCPCFLVCNSFLTIFFFLKWRQAFLLIKENETKAQSTKELYKEQKVKTNNQTNYPKTTSANTRKKRPKQNKHKEQAKKAKTNRKNEDKIEPKRREINTKHQNFFLQGMMGHFTKAIYYYKNRIVTFEF